MQCLTVTVVPVVPSGTGRDISNIGDVRSIVTLGASVRESGGAALGVFCGVPGWQIIRKRGGGGHQTTDPQKGGLLDS